MTKFEATKESRDAHAALIRAREAFSTRLDAFTKEAIIAIDDIANRIGKPMWDNKTGELLGEVAGYMFDYDEIDEGFTIEGYLYLPMGSGEQREVDAADMQFEDPANAPTPKKTRKAKGESNADG